MQRVTRHTGEVKADLTQTKVGADGQATTEEHKILGIETRALVAAGLMGVFAYAIFKHDPVPRKPKPKSSAIDGFLFGGSSGKKGYSRRQLEEEVEQEVDELEDAIDEEFEHTDLDEDELNFDESESDEEEDDEEG